MHESFLMQKGSKTESTSSTGEREGEERGGEGVVNGGSCRSESSRSSPALDVTSDVDHHHSSSHPSSAHFAPSSTTEKITPIDLHGRDSRNREQSSAPRTPSSPSTTESSEGESLVFHTPSSFHWICIHITCLSLC